MPLDRISIRGARQHNLKNVSLDIPRDKLVVITGVSGSGKSSLAFDTIYAEGQRRYVESLSSYARQFLGQMDKPDVDYIEGLSPAVSIDQKSTSRNPRSTVATVTEIYDYLRLMFARVGIPHCPQCGKRITQQSVEQMVDTVLELPEGTRVQILAPVIRGRKGEYRKELEDIRKQGFVRLRVDGEMREVTDDIQLDRYKQHTIEVVVDRLVRREGVESRLSESIESALKLTGGILSALYETPKADADADPTTGELTFSEHFSCLDCGISLEELAPRNFSFNSPYGACPACHGLGTHTEFDENLVLEPDKSIEQGGIIPFATSTSDYVNQIFRSVAKSAGHNERTALGKWSEEGRKMLLFGTEKPVPVTYTNHHGRIRSYSAQFEGVIGMLQRRHTETGSQLVKEDLERYMSTRPCEACKGARLKPESLAVTVGDCNISQVTSLSIGKSLNFLNNLELTAREQTIGRQILKEIQTRLGFLKDVGLDYLTLDRSATTLAGGEAQRIRLATQIGSGLMGVLYILDEPSIGLHQRDNQRLIDTLTRLRNLGNTVLVVEHDEETIAAADWVIDIGPGAGEGGGHVVAAGTPQEISENPESVTGAFLSGQARIEVPTKRRDLKGKQIELKGARSHNLKNVDITIPLGCFVAVTGVSGSGKSTLIQETLYPRLMHKLHGTRTVWGEHDEITGFEQIDKVIDIDQSPIGRTPRSNPATYTGVFDQIRDLFAATPEAKVRGYMPGRFSFNVKGGRCESCKGDGIIKIEMHFLPDVYVPCEVCKGRRYNRETLEVRYRGKNISEVLEMTVAEACQIFENIPPINRKLSTLRDVGLEYIRMGQPATTLSGGEAQRVKLASELSKRSTGRTLYLLDEPTTGLHFRDIQKLLEVLTRLVDVGNTVVVIEHNLDVIKTADWVIDMGPEGGDGGGSVVVSGTPEVIAQEKASHTGRFLKKVLIQRGYLNQPPAEVSAPTVSSAPPAPPGEEAKPKKPARTKAAPRPRKKAEPAAK
jgi:excinuclease ABC subunit A